MPCFVAFGFLSPALRVTLSAFERLIAKCAPSMASMEEGEQLWFGSRTPSLEQGARDVTNSRKDEATAFQVELVPKGVIATRLDMAARRRRVPRLGFQCFPVLFIPEAVGVARLGFLHFERMFPQRAFVPPQTFVTGNCPRCRLQIIFLPLCGPSFFPN